jgi:predicted NAD/FAD-binding protein
MTGAIWSASFSDILRFPARSILQFLDNHGLLASTGAPRWRTIVGGSQEHVRALASRVSGAIRCGIPVLTIRRDDRGVTLGLASGERQAYDKVVLATHADEALGLLGDPLDEEMRLLGRFRYSINDAVLHTDIMALPGRRAAWSSWNCAMEDCRDEDRPASLTYYIND